MASRLAGTLTPQKAAGVRPAINLPCMAIRAQGNLHAALWCRDFHGGRAITRLRLLSSAALVDSASTPPGSIPEEQGSAIFSPPASGFSARADVGHRRGDGLSHGGVPRSRRRRSTPQILCAATVGGTGQWRSAGTASKTHRKPEWISCRPGSGRPTGCAGPEPVRAHAALSGYVPARAPPNGRPFRDHVQRDRGCYPRAIRWKNVETPLAGLPRGLAGDRIAPRPPVLIHGRDEPPIGALCGGRGGCWPPPESRIPATRSRASTMRSLPKPQNPVRLCRG